jgi:FdhD protein
MPVQSGRQTAGAMGRVTLPAHTAGFDLAGLMPRLTQAHAPLTSEARATNELGRTVPITVPAERALTIYVDKRELVTLMTLGADSITVDWDVGAATVKTRHGIADLAAKTEKRVITTGCGQGSVFGGLMDDVGSIHLPEATLTQAQLYGIVNAIRLKESTYKSAGSVHACALFRGEDLLLFVEDVGRHNALDTIAGWMAMQEDGNALGADKVFYTTGRLTSEMVIKSAQMGVPIVISRSGITQMGLTVATQLGLCAIGRATNQRFLCYSAAHRLVYQPS